MRSRDLRPRLSLGTKVTGTYHGVPFSGVIVDGRQSASHFRDFIYYVDLDAAIEVNGVTRSSLAVSIDVETGSTAGNPSTRLEQAA